MHVCNYAVNKSNAGNTSKTKNYNRSIIIYTHALNISLLAGHGATIFIQRKTPDREVATFFSFGFYVQVRV